MTEKDKMRVRTVLALAFATATPDQSRDVEGPVSRDVGEGQ
jgi:hypothetical protein